MRRPAMPRCLGGVVLAGALVLNLCAAERDLAFVPMPLAPPVASVAMSPDGRYLVVVHGKPATVTVWDVAAEQVCLTVPGGDPQQVLTRTKQAYVLHRAGGTVAVIELGDKPQEGKRLSLGTVPANRLWAPPEQRFAGKLYVVGPDAQVYRHYSHTADGVCEFNVRSDLITKNGVWEIDVASGQVDRTKSPPDDVDDQPGGYPGSTGRAELGSPGIWAVFVDRTRRWFYRWSRTGIDACLARPGVPVAGTYHVQTPNQVNVPEASSPPQSTEFREPASQVPKAPRCRHEGSFAATHGERTHLFMLDADRGALRRLVVPALPDPKPEPGDNGGAKGLAVLPTPHFVSGLTFSEDGRYAVLCHEWDNCLTIWDVAEARLLATVAMPSPRYAICRGGSIYVANFGQGLSVVDLAKATITKRIDLPNPLVYYLDACGGKKFAGKVTVCAGCEHGYTAFWDVNMVTGRVGQQSQIFSPGGVGPAFVGIFDSATPHIKGWRSQPLDRYYREARIWWPLRAYVPLDPCRYLWFQGDSVVLGIPPKHLWREKEYQEGLAVPDSGGQMFYCFGADWVEARQMTGDPTPIGLSPRAGLAASAAWLEAQPKTVDPIPIGRWKGVVLPQYPDDEAYVVPVPKPEPLSYGYGATIGDSTHIWLYGSRQLNVFYCRLSVAERQAPVAEPPPSAPPQFEVVKLPGPAQATAMSEDGRLSFASSGPKNFVSVLDAEPAAVFVPMPLESPVIGAAMSPDGRYLVVVHGKPATVTVWDVAAEQVCLTVPGGDPQQVLTRARQAYVLHRADRAVAIIELGDKPQEGKRLRLGQVSAYRLWAPPDYRFAGKLYAVGPGARASPDAPDGNKVWEIDIASGQVVAAPAPPEDEDINDSPRVLPGFKNSWNLGTTDIWVAFADRSRRWLYRWNAKGIEACRQRPGLPVVATYHVQLLKEVQAQYRENLPLGASGGPRAAAAGPCLTEGAFAATHAGRTHLFLLDLQHGSLLRLVAPAFAEPKAEAPDEGEPRVFRYLPTEFFVSSFTVSEDGARAVLCHEWDNCLTIWDLAEARLQTTVKMAVPRHAICRGGSAYVANFGQGLSVVDLATGALVKRISLPDPLVYHLAAPAGKHFAGHVLACAGVRRPQVPGRPDPCGYRTFDVDAQTGQIAREHAAVRHTSSAPYPHLSSTGADVIEGGKSQPIEQWFGNPEALQRAPTGGLDLPPHADLDPGHSLWFLGRLVGLGFPPNRLWLEQDFDCRLMIPDGNGEVFYCLGKDWVEARRMSTTPAPVGRWEAVTFPEYLGNNTWRPPRKSPEPLAYGYGATIGGAAHVWAYGSRQRGVFYCRLPAAEAHRPPPERKPSDQGPAARFDIVDLPGPVQATAMSEDGRFLFASDGPNDIVSALDVERGTVVRKLETPYPGALLAVGQRLYVFNQRRQTLAVFRIGGDWRQEDEVEVGHSGVVHLSAPQGEYFRGEVLATAKWDWARPGDGQLVSENAVILIDVRKDSARVLDRKADFGVYSFDCKGEAVVGRPHSLTRPTVFGLVPLQTFLQGGAPTDKVAEPPAYWAVQCRPDGPWFVAGRALYQHRPFRRLFEATGEWSKVVPDVTESFFFLVRRDAVERRSCDRPGEATARWALAGEYANGLLLDSGWAPPPTDWATTHGDASFLFILDRNAGLLRRVRLEAPRAPDPGVAATPGCIPVRADDVQLGRRFDGNGMFALDGQELLLLSADGGQVKTRLPLEREYLKVVDRGTHFIALGPDRLDRLDVATGKVTKTMALGDQTGRDIVGHPKMGVCYVAVDRGLQPKEDLLQSRIVFEVQDADLRLRRLRGVFGQALAIDPSGRRLFTFFSEPYETGRYNVQASLFLHPFGPDFLDVTLVPVMASVDLLMGYELEKRDATLYKLNPKPPDGLYQLIVSGDGATVMAVAGRLRQDEYVGKRLQVRAVRLYKAETLDPAWSDDAAREIFWYLGPGIDWHPSLPLLADGSVLRSFAATPEQPVEQQLVGQKPVLGKGHPGDGVCFAADGRHVVLFQKPRGGERCLRSLLLPRLSEALQAQLAAAPVGAVRPPLLDPDTVQARRVVKPRHLPHTVLTALGPPETQKRPSNALYGDLAPGAVLVRSQAGQASAFLVGADGYFVTTAFVVPELEGEITVTIVDPKAHEKSRRMAPAEVVALDRERHLALLKVDLGGQVLQGPRVAQALRPAWGQPVFVIAQSGALDAPTAPAITAGKISGDQRSLLEQHFWQTDAPVHPGMPGGATVDEYGNLVGMVSLKLDLDRVAFLVPHTTVCEFLEQLTVGETR